MFNYCKVAEGVADKDTGCHDIEEGEDREEVPVDYIEEADQKVEAVSHMLEAEEDLAEEADHKQQLVQP